VVFHVDGRRDAHAFFNVRRESDGVRNRAVHSSAAVSWTWRMAVVRFLLGKGYDVDVGGTQSKTMMDIFTGHGSQCASPFAISCVCFWSSFQSLHPTYPGLGRSME